MVINDRVVIAIDGGGTHTRLRLATPEGRAIRERTVDATVKPFIVGMPTAAARIAAWCDALAKEELVPAQAIRGVGIGLAGIGNDRDRAAFVKTIRKALAMVGIAPRRLRIETDAAAALYGAFPEGPGIVVIAGTGAIMVGRTPRGVIVRVGGWGAAVGDEGSATWIGVEALRAITRHVDGRSKSPRLVRAFTTRFPALRPLAPRDLRSAISSGAVTAPMLAPVVTSLAVAGDPVCLVIARAAAAALADQVAALVMKHFPPSCIVPVVLHGGVVEHSVVGAMTKRAMQRRLGTRVTVVDAPGTPLDGAFHFATRAMPTITI